MDYIYLIAFNTFQWIILHTPDFIKFPIIKGLARLAYFLDAKHRHIAKVNLDLAFEDSLNETEKREIIKKVYENLLFNLADFVKNQGISKEELLSKVKFENVEVIENAKKSGKPIIFMTAHYGNWELLALAIAAKFGPLSVVGRPLDSKVMNKILERNRKQFDIEVIPKKGAMRPLIKALKNGRSVGLLVDQNTSDNDGVLIDFFGKKARHTPAVSILAKRMNAIIIPAFIQTDDHKVYTISFYTPLKIKNSGNNEEDILENIQAQANITEQVICQKSEEWFWLHKRWKNQYESYYK
ncbi:lipid A biosynthesis lauroyl acyltransferase [Hydrogenimonas thermophila]|uniref:lipid A biosynthesis lauroyl acyltransferase n=1 Tax=Hydrogenimonas thermophila TaxID=223786 RepID=UPI0029371E08|nr:lipid A biosynthesis lauroyl acyltransferase [Hydrogenimonas thermophila]WOE71179.1 lipid A biosynthesis lauroyl acyltransferase [Hydrogenimonas thermophila]WOE73700.1 lipid A biosynthesis lauroyl acyltransferase [Hydrogenimonas thermophila]